ncbi:hypothetical protein M197_gp25 [Haloarcula hispanica tailed virus 2]|uniref:Uncharacterized protein n=1 Tax=Haloarcula hispanica tailed virus 2 TaxID=1273751 RepID=R4T8I3_9CAUD|nr:hypothetical protein M197_gp25 [Haloarcula hispanica tailed virus 2]AGM11190.1 hypothetical protein HHTV2_25 [Haloarcula hispanica tailed virus 2]
MPDLLPPEVREDLCREGLCIDHGSGTVGCPVKDVERAIQDRLSTPCVEEAAHRGVSQRGSKAWEVYRGNGERVHTSSACALNGEPLSKPQEGILAFLHDSDAGNRLYLITEGLGMPPEAIPDEYRTDVGPEDLCGSCAGDLKDALPEDVNR